jgi:arylsulfatase A-like enzyme
VLRTAPVVACCLLLGCGGANEAPPRVVLISLDTCRADHLSCYGYGGETTPAIDAVAADGIVFENVVSPVPLTLPAHCTMLTGLLPPSHGVRDNRHYVLDDAVETLAERLRAAGMATGAVVGSIVIDAAHGLAQGFDTYDDDFRHPRQVLEGLERRADEVSDIAIDWLTGHQDGPFFLFVHYYDPHRPYEAPARFASRFPESPYAAEIAYTDAQVGRVIAHLRELDLYDSSLVIITADHGEMLGEHGEDDHSYFIYQGAVSVPLVVKPARRGDAGVVPAVRRVEAPAGLFDIVPTILGELDLEPADGLGGLDLSSRLSSPTDSAPLASAPRDLYCESLRPTDYDANPLFGLLHGDWKYIRTTRPELYDLARDPHELRDLVDAEPGVAARLAARLDDLIERLERRGSAASRGGVDAETRARLAALGYVGGAVREGFAIDPALADPKDLIGVHRAIERAYRMFVAGRPELADAISDSVVTARPDLMATQLCRADLLGRMGRDAECIEHYEAVIEHGTTEPSVFYDCGTSRATIGDLDGALRDFDRALELDPGYAQAHVNRGVILSQQGDVAGALASFDRAVAADPGLANAWSNRGQLRAAQGDVTGALEDFGRAITADPRFVPAYYHRGQLRARMGDQAGARRDLDTVRRLQQQLQQHIR